MQEFEWHTEEHTQQLLIDWLRNNGWNIISSANTSTREHGVDVVAERAHERLGVEVKGYPSRLYVAGPNKGEKKNTPPASQAPKWFAHAIVPAMKLLGREPESRSAICFPNFPIYRKLWSETASSLRAARVELWLVNADGTVEVLA